MTNLTKAQRKALTFLDRVGREMSFTNCTLRRPTISALWRTGLVTLDGDRFEITQAGRDALK